MPEKAGGERGAGEIGAENSLSASCKEWFHGASKQVENLVLGGKKGC